MQAWSLGYVDQTLGAGAKEREEGRMHWLNALETLRHAAMLNSGNYDGWRVTTPCTPEHVNECVAVIRAEIERREAVGSAEEEDA